MMVRLKAVCRARFDGYIEMEPEEFSALKTQLEVLKVQCGAPRGGKNAYLENELITKLMDRAGLDAEKPTNWSNISMESFEPIPRDRHKVSTADTEADGR